MRSKIKINFRNKVLYVLFISAIFDLLRYMINCVLKDIFKNPIIKLLLISLGESLSIILYIIYLKKNSYRNKKSELFYSSRNKRFINFMLFLCSFLKVIGNFDFLYFYSYKIKKREDILDNLDIIFFTLLVCINEHSILKIQTYKHHKLGIFLIIFALIILTLSNYLRIFNQFNTKKFIYVIILSFENQFLLSYLYIIEKKLNYEYFINIFKMSCFEGLFGIIIIIFLMIINQVFFIDSILNFNNFSLFIKQINNILNFLLIITFIILSCLINIFRLKITEFTRPSTNSIGHLLSIFFIDIFDSFYKGPKIQIFSYDIIFSSIFSIIGTFIFCEVIVLNFCNFDKYTFDKLSRRSEDDTIKTINFLSFSSGSDYSGSINE
jgi:hypothetical protein